MRFANRLGAGRRLAEALAAYAGRPDVVVLGLPRGGVPVAAEVARALGAPLDVFLVRKLGVPGHEELAMGAIASGGVRVLNEDVLDGLRIPAAVVEDITDVEAAEMARRGAGEILLTSMDRDGTRVGYDLDLVRAVVRAVPVPVIASGGVGSLEHLLAGLTVGGADAALAASIFHMSDHSVREAKEFLARAGVPVRPARAEAA